MTTHRANLRSSPVSGIALFIAATVGCAMTMGLMGCAKPLLSPAEERSQFDRYDAMRAQHSPQYIENEYGRREPNLRGRLSPKN
ncbi:MAG: hypothetical protein K2W85_14795 [Phycisphaerales bacterium]|nr:hypothetical protein [Phycisphaerales bacterium]